MLVSKCMQVPCFMHSGMDKQTVYHEELGKLKADPIASVGIFSETIKVANIFPDLECDDECCNAIIKCLDGGTLNDALRLARTDVDLQKSISSILFFDIEPKGRQQEVVCLLIFEQLITRCWKDVVEPLLSPSGPVNGKSKVLLRVPNYYNYYPIIIIILLLRIIINQPNDFTIAINGLQNSDYHSAYLFGCMYD